MRNRYRHAIEQASPRWREVDATVLRERAVNCDLYTRRSRYPDLHAKYCAAGRCDTRALDKHFRDHGLREGRLFGCDGEANGTAPALESSCGRDKKYDDSFRVAVCFWGVHLCTRLSCHDSCARSLNLISAQA